MLKKYLTILRNDAILIIEREVRKMDAWKDLYYDCVSCDKYLREQIKEHEKAIKKLQKEIKENRNFLKKLLDYLLTNV